MEWATLARSYRPPYNQLAAFTPLTIREALNKIAHPDPKQTAFFADRDTHDLILGGTKGNNNWIAVISVVDLCRAIGSIPDAVIRP